jgi:ABC-2 type transport system permease protein
MSGFRVLLAKELAEQVRTLRLIVLAIVFVSFGILSPLTAKYLPDLIEALGGDQLGIVITIPTPTIADAIDQLLKNVSQFGILAAILLAMGAVATEKDRGTAAFVLSKPASRAAFLGAKIAAIALDLLLAVAAAGVAGFGYTAYLFNAPPADGYIAMCLLLWLSLVVYASLTFLGSTLTRSAAAGAGIGFAFLVLTSIVGAVPSIGRLMPGGLLGPARAYGLGASPGDVAGPVLFNLAFVAILAAASWLTFRRQEL